MNGTFDVSESAYHADDIGSDVPSLSRTTAHVLISQSPRHAWNQHPRLNPNWEPEADPGKYELGTIAHQLFLGGPDRLVVIDADNWRTKAAQEERFQARVQGKIALLAREHGQVLEMVDALVRQTAAHSANPPLFTDGKPEQTITWEENGVLCRARLDWLRDDRSAIDDLKTTSRIAGASPRAFSKALFSSGYDLQVAAYTSAVEKIHGRSPEFRFVVIETEPPYAMSVVSLAGDALELARRKWLFAVELWRDCLKSGEWPAYDSRVAYAHAPAWHEAEWLELLEVAA